jgi:hypothetical protein
LRLVNVNSLSFLALLAFFAVNHFLQDDLTVKDAKRAKERAQKDVDD